MASFGQPRLRPRLLRVFEHETLRFPGEREGVPFTEADLQALSHFHERTSSRYFSLVHRGIRLSHYVGILQVGELTLEILPKTDRPTPDQIQERLWQTVLLDMLRECRLLRTETNSLSAIQSVRGSLLDIYLQTFVSEVSSLLRKGLLKAYRRTTQNRTSLKGKLHFGAHLRENLVHQERFFVEYPTFDAYHPLHQIVYLALRKVPQLATQADIHHQAQALLAYFPAQSDLTNPLPTLEKVERSVKHDRRFIDYRAAFGLARLILTGFRPDMRSGSTHTFSLLFDMNRLFEEYIYRQLKRQANDSIRVERQVPTAFWGKQPIRPDVIVRIREADYSWNNYVVDTKWKTPPNARPDDADLKQMYVYNQHYQAAKSVLIYPQIVARESHFGRFHLPNPFLTGSSTPQAHGCEIVFVQVIENGRLKPTLGQELLQQIRADIPAY